MPCKHHKDALMEAAASGAEPQGELRAHLDFCVDCRAAFEQEQSLFASIDAGLHVAANVEVPVSLLPRVRARLDEEIAPQRRWIQPLIFAAASVALLFAVFLFARPHPTRPDNQAKQTPQIPASKPPTTNVHNPNSVPGTQIISSNVNSSQTRGCGDRRCKLLSRLPDNTLKFRNPPTYSRPQDGTGRCHRQCC